jgi:hypothetical protein
MAGLKYIFIMNIILFEILDSSFTMITVDEPSIEVKSGMIRR